MGSGGTISGPHDAFTEPSRNCSEGDKFKYVKSKYVSRLLLTLLITMNWQMSDTVGVGVKVGVGVNVSVGVEDSVGVGGTQSSGVAVGLGVSVKVAVIVGVEVLVGVLVDVCQGRSVGP